MTLSTDTKYQAVDFIQSYTGRAVFPLAPTPDMISVIDIAHHLASQCRYVGGTTQFYSTAQHCCILSDYLEVRKRPSLDCLQILMHDAAEAYLVDVPRPIKQHMPEYRKWDHDLTMCIREWLGLKYTPIPDWQDELDSRIIVDERAQVMTNTALDWKHDLEPLGVVIEPWLPRKAEQEFLARYSAHSANVFGSYQYLRSGWGIETNSIYTPDFRTRGSDMAQKGPVEPHTITDLIEVDVRGGVGRVVLRTPDGMMIRDPDAGSYPRPAWDFIHGKFELVKESKSGEASDGVG